MRLRTAAHIASRVLAIYVAFTSIIFSGELIHALIEREPAGIVAESALPAGVSLLLAAALWFGAPAIARRLTDDAPDQDAGSPVTARAIATIAFAVAGFYIAAQALPLAVHALIRLTVGEGTGRDIAADLASAIARTGIGLALARAASPLARRLFGSRA